MATAGTLMGSATWSAGKVGKAVALNGVDAYVRLPSAVMVDLEDFTIAVWVYLNKENGNAHIFDFGSDSGTYMMLTPRNGPNIARFAITTNLAVGEQSIKGSAPVPAGRWVHVAVTRAGNVGTLYIDKVAVGSNTSMDLAPFQLGHTTQNWIGRSSQPADPYLDGLVDDFRIYPGSADRRPNQSAVSAGVNSPLNPKNSFTKGARKESASGPIDRRW
jgi:hypothetical protein